MKSVNKRLVRSLAGIITGIIVLFTQPVFAVEIPLSTAQEVASNFITYLDETYLGENYTIKDIEPLEEESGKIVGFLVKLKPQGYILVAGDTIRVPIKAYSFTSNFENLPTAYVQVLLNELKIEAATRSALLRQSTTAQPEEINQPYWDFLTQTNPVSRKSLRSYKPDTFLLTTKWDQGYPYNKFNPKVGDELTVTGCVQTAIAQVMRYHAHPTSGTGFFTHNWSGKELTAVMNRPFNWNEMPDSVDGSVPQYQQDEVAALMRDLGVLNEATFDISSKGGTGAYFHTEQFERAFGYAPVSEMDSSNANFFTTIRTEINNSRPFLLAMDAQNSGEAGHMVVADGYASDGSGKKIHLNLGWGGSNDAYYYLDQTNKIGDYTFAASHTIYYNIKPCSGSECNPYTPTTSGTNPVIGSYQNGALIPAPNDMVIDKAGTDIIRIENYDLDGDAVTLSATSSSNKLQLNVVGNLLTLTPTTSDIFCEITLNAQSYDGNEEKKFKVLVLDETIYFGSNYDIGGQFANQDEIDQYKVYLDGNTTIVGDMGYSNTQGFYVWIKDNSGNTVVDGTNSPISKSFTAGVYTIYTSLKYTKPSGGYSLYEYDSDHSGYTITVTCSNLNSTVSDLASSLEIELSDDTTLPPLPESINSYKVLTDSSNPFTINYGDYVKIFGSKGVNTINVKSGGRVECVNFVGANIINIEDKFSDFTTVYRSGATVYLESSIKGTKIKIPATKTSQTLNFENGSDLRSLVIDGGQVKLAGVLLILNKKGYPQHFLYFFPLPHGQGSFLPILGSERFTGSFT
ncbi:MAG: C10 family peptidase [Desulfamplus sp.]|nr:C10 family peptidase [Desulfamplus sp.]